jgi:hypothetical protein
VDSTPTEGREVFRLARRCTHSRSLSVRTCGVTSRWPQPVPIEREWTRLSRLHLAGIDRSTQIELTSSNDDPIYLFPTVLLTPLHHLAPDPMNLIRHNRARSKGERSVRLNRRAEMRSSDIVFIAFVIGSVRDYTHRGGVVSEITPGKAVVGYEVPVKTATRGVVMVNTSGLLQIWKETVVDISYTQDIRSLFCRTRSPSGSSVASRDHIELQVIRLAEDPNLSRHVMSLSISFRTRAEPIVKAGWHRGQTSDQDPHQQRSEYSAKSKHKVIIDMGSSSSKGARRLPRELSKQAEQRASAPSSAAQVPNKFADASRVTTGNVEYSASRTSGAGTEHGRGRQNVYASEERDDCEQGRIDGGLSVEESDLFTPS